MENCPLGEAVSWLSALSFDCRSEVARWLWWVDLGEREKLSWWGCAKKRHEPGWRVVTKFMSEIL